MVRAMPCEHEYPSTGGLRCVHCNVEAVPLLILRVAELDAAVRHAIGYLVLGARDDAEKVLRGVLKP